MLKAGYKYNLKVERKTDIGYILININQEEVFLHNNETNFKDLKVGDKVEAFLFHDNKGRLAATLYKPHIVAGEDGWLKVADQNKKLGVFLDNGINKDLLLSKDDLPKNTKLWPRKGDKLYVKMKAKNRLIAKLVTPDNSSLEDFEQNSEVKATLVKILDDKLIFLTDNLTVLTVDLINIRKPYRLGARELVRIGYQHENSYEGLLTEAKEIQRLDDAEIILNHLKKTKVMKLTSKSSPEDIYEVFQMSKKAFKRALGHLYKKRLVEFKKDYTILVEE